MEAQEKLSLLEDMLELEEGSLEVTTSLESVESWDSLAAISLIALVDEHFEKRLTAVQIKEFKTVQDILNFME
ncbi:phosphopantetheine-binding protein [Paenibacillus sp. MABNR03]|uniref:phosphopantetheine-binding protein n=1 Tax=Paenibacillus sp. MABNR03 TaxID=3142626 RepID=UPI003D2BFF9C